MVLVILFDLGNQPSVICSQQSVTQRAFPGSTPGARGNPDGC
jgi:hypothetical protein